MTATDFIQIIGTAAFAISGYLVGYNKRLDVLGVVITALLTAVGGGMIRDGLVGRIPQVFLQTDALIVLLGHLGWINIFTLNLLFAGGLLFRLTAYRFHWQLPGFQRRRK